MRWLFKPSLSYAMMVSVIITVSIYNAGHLWAAVIWVLVSSIAGGITEAEIMDR